MSISPAGTQLSNLMPTVTSDDTRHVISVASSGQNGDPQRPVLERWWHEKRDEILRSGYKLCFRYTFRWQPWWLRSDRRFLTSEEDDPSGVIMDAIRIQDGLPVILILVESPHELTTNQLLQEFVQRPDNHCVPMLEVVELQQSGSHQLMVFPHLLPFHRSPIRTFEEFVIFITQVCEGIQFMHQMNIAYGNCTTGHIMFDPSGRNPNDWLNPPQINRGRNFVGGAGRRLSRTQGHPRYYLADLGLSRQYTRRTAPDQPLPSVDMSLPEGRLDGLSDPFCMDIYSLGNLVRENFVQKYCGFEFVQVLVDAMTDTNPEQRPTIEQVVDRLTLASRSLSEIDLRSTFVLKDPELTRTTRLFRSILYNLQRRPSKPTP